ncbi:MAG: MFS transporter [Chloroflexota bacterium]|nr:MFS transporter [Chloroflexota bacterium]
MSHESHDNAAKRTGRAYAVLRFRDYRLLWSAEIISTLGTQIQRVAVAWQVFELTGDPLQLGLLGLCRFVPILIFGLAGGVMADRGDRRRTLVTSQLALLAISAILAALTLTGNAHLLVIYLVTIVGAMVSAVAGPTRQALVPLLVPRQEMAGAMTMNILGSQVSAVAGPAIGGLIISQWGLAAAYGLDALSFVAVIVAVLAMRARPEPPVRVLGGWDAALEGLRFLRQSPILLGIMSVDFVATFFGASTVLMPIFATEILGVGPSGLGVLLAAPAAGAVAGSAIMSVARLPAWPGRGVLIAVATYGACMLGFGLSQTFLISILFLIGSGAADAVSMALRHTMRNLATPDALRGRVAAAHTTFAAGGPQLGEFEAGAVAALVGAGQSVTLGGAGTIIAAMLVAWRVPAIASYQTTKEAPVALSPRESIELQREQQREDAAVP